MLGKLPAVEAELGLSRFNGQVAKPPAQPIMDAMTRQRRRFTPQQKAEAIALCQNEGLTILEASKRLGIHPTCLGRWVRQAGIDAQGPTKAGPLSTSERDEMTRMRKEIRELRRERDFFKLAAAHFAKEQLSPKSINS
jgi:transposase